jgi:AmmeMemoRadiSam system protein B
MIRKAVVAGQFYPGSREALLHQVQNLVDATTRKEDAIGVVSPHAGYIYSGPVAGAVLSSITPRSTYIIMGPNHTGLGRPFGLEASSSWKTPLGDIEIDKALSDRIKANCRFIEYDALSHAHEHSIEVQLPFLQYVQKKMKLVPITISHAPIDVYKAVGSALAKSVKELKLEKDVMIIASSDMTHYEPQKQAQAKDRLAIDAILALDEDRLMKVVSENDISMCGYAPTTIMLVAAKELGAKSAKLIKYGTSGDVTGDYSSVVGYAGIIVK